MTFNRISGLTLGFSIGIIIAIIAFGVYWASNNLNKNMLKTQALQEKTTSVPTITESQLLSEASPTPPGQQSDSLVNRLAPSEDQVITDISDSLKQLYGPKE